MLPTSGVDAPLPFAIVRPFHDGDYGKILTALRHRLVAPCLFQRGNLDADLIIYHGGTQLLDAAHWQQLQELLRDPFWSSCFRKTRIVSTRIVSKYPRAPCQQFFRLFGLAEGKPSDSLLGLYSVFYYMEPDVWPIHDGWVEVMFHHSRQMLKLGGWIYGTGWDSQGRYALPEAAASGEDPPVWDGKECRGFTGQCAPINGNALYSLSSTSFMSLLNLTSTCKDPNYDRTFYYETQPGNWAPPGGWLEGEREQKLRKVLFMSHCKAWLRLDPHPPLWTVRARYPAAVVWHGHTDCGVRGWCNASRPSRSSGAANTSSAPIDRQERWKRLAVMADRARAEDPTRNWAVG